MTIQEQLRLHEGWKRFPYTDTVGKLTIGCGRNLTDKGLSDEEIAYLLEHDITEARTDLERYSWWAGLDEVRQRVLIDMRFNLGPEGWRTMKRLPVAVAERDFHKAALVMRQLLWFRQTKTRGERLATWMYHGEER